MLSLEDMSDEAEIVRIRRLWAFARDQSDWPTVAACFHPGAQVSVSWFAGPAEEFIEKSKKLMGDLKPELRSKHWLGSYRIWLKSPRALLETDIEVRGRDTIDGHLFDFTYQGRFFDRFEKRDGLWRIAQWTCLYDKDRFDPVVPGSVPASFFEGLALTGPENGIAYQRFRQKRGGRPAAPSIVLGGSDSEKRLKAEGQAWLGGG